MGGEPEDEEDGGRDPSGLRLARSGRKISYTTILATSYREESYNMSDVFDIEQAFNRIHERFTAIENSISSNKKLMESYTKGLKPVIDSIAEDIAYLKGAVDDIKASISVGFRDKES